MVERIVDAAMTITRPGGDESYFFLTDQYVIYDWTSDRVRDGIHGIDELAIPPTFAAPGPATTIETALAGKRPFSGLLYLFHEPSYMRFEAGPPVVPNPPTSSPITAWNLPAGFEHLDASFNGALNREGFCYFFKGPDYLRYIWSRDTVDAGYPRPMARLANMPADFASGIDAAVDGGGAFTHRGYLFRNEEYLPFQWVNTGEPHAVVPAKPIQDNWVGLREMLMAAKAKSNALLWLGAARPQVTAFLATLTAGVPYLFNQGLMDAALSTHFHIDPSQPAAAKAVTVGTIATMLASVEATLRSSGTYRYRIDSEAVADGNAAIDAAYTWPYPPPSPPPHINITRNFPRRNENNRILSLIHEAVHVNDGVSHTPDNHISEWYLTDPVAASFGLAPVAAMPATFATRYDLMVTANAVHNPSSYAAFTRHIFFAADSRQLP